MNFDLVINEKKIAVHVAAFNDKQKNRIIYLIIANREIIFAEKSHTGNWSPINGRTTSNTLQEAIFAELDKPGIIAQITPKLNVADMHRYYTDRLR